MGVKKGWAKKGMPVVLINNGHEGCYRVGDRGIIYHVSSQMHDFGCGSGKAIQVDFENGNRWWCTENMLTKRVLKKVI